MTKREKKKRIAELRAELKSLQATPRSDWHTAFEAFLRFTMHKYKGVTIQTEVEIGTDAPRTDYLILTEDELQEFKEAIFKIFKKVNLIEYKNPRDSLNKRVIFKIIGYASLLIGTAERKGDMPESQVTISIFRAAKNPKLFKEMEEAGELVKTDTPGIYHVKNLTSLPFQIVITSELEGEEYAACRALTDRAREADVKRVLENVSKETDDIIREYYGTFIELVADKNPEMFEEMREEKDMKTKYPTIMRIFGEDLKQLAEEQAKQQMEEQVKQQVEERVEQQVKTKEQETLASSIKNLMANLKFTLEQAMDALSIPQSDRAAYAELIRKNH